MLEPGRMGVPLFLHGYGRDGLILCRVAMSVMGIKPTVRGTAMSPRDHPHGGGEGRQPVGMSGPKSPWGKPTRGYRTRRNKKTDQYIVRRRNAGNR